MATVFDPLLLAQAMSDVGTAKHASQAALSAWQHQRLGAVLGHARQASALYRERLQGVDAAVTDGEYPHFAQLAHMVPVRRGELMARFDDWVTDPGLTLDGLTDFLADTAHIGAVYQNKYLVWESSGTGGSPGVFVQDARCMAVYDALETLRQPLGTPWQRLVDPMGLTQRLALVGATQGHFASLVSFERLRAVQPWRAGGVASCSILQPTAALVAELHAFAPNVLATYPTAAVLLAEEARQGRFRPQLREVLTGGETLTPAMRLHIETHLHAPVRHSYGSSEFLPMGWECPHGHMHLNTDWLLLEPVDEHHRPVPPGQTSASVLLTSLVNTVQPLIRYEMGDHVTFSTEGCACGSPFPVVSVLGRRDDVLRLRGGDGTVPLLPLAVSTVLEEQAGLFDFQVRQRNDHTLVLCLPGRGEAAAQALARGCAALAAFATAQGARDTQVKGELGHTTPRGHSGKCCRIMPLAH